MKKLLVTVAVSSLVACGLSEQEEVIIEGSKEAVDTAMEEFSSSIVDNYGMHQIPPTISIEELEAFDPTEEQVAYEELPEILPPLYEPELPPLQEGV